MEAAVAAQAPGSPQQAGEGPEPQDAPHGAARGVLGVRVASRMLMHGVDARQRGDTERAIDIFRDVVWACPGQAPPLWNLGEALVSAQRYDEACEWFWRAARMVPFGPQAHFAWRNLGVCHWKMGQPREALPFFRKALAVNPHDQESRHDLAVISLAEGDYETGWEQYLWRLVVQRTKRPLSPLPRPFNERVVLIPEQGLGDVLYFMRWVPALRDLGVEELHCRYPSKIADVMRRAFPDIIEGFGDEGCIDLRTGDLPFLTGVPGPLPPVPLRAVNSGPPPSFSHYHAPFIGVTWRAGTKNALGQWKEMQPEKLAALCRDLGATPVLLQRSATNDEKRLFGEARDYCDECEYPEFVLDLLPHLDAYVTVSNTNVHLAAGLPDTMRPDMHVLITHPPETRWMTRGDTSPWFPGMTCYRQDGYGRWPDDTFQRIKDALRK